MEFTQVRHGTHIIKYKGIKILVDPVLADIHTMPKLVKGRFDSKNPMVKLPFDTNYFNEIDYLMLTHLHFDHFDKQSKKLIDKDIDVICSDDNKKQVFKSGFKNVVGIKDKIILNKNIEIQLIRGGKHGINIEGKLMGDVFGYVIKDLEEIEPTVYIVGDSIWCNTVQKNIKDKDIIILFGGEAKLPFGKNITMNAKDIERVALNSNSKIIVNHMDTWNHCHMTRDDLKMFIKNKKYADRILIPVDGESILL